MPSGRSAARVRISFLHICGDGGYHHAHNEVPCPDNIPLCQYLHLEFLSHFSSLFIPPLCLANLFLLRPFVMPYLANTRPSSARRFFLLLPYSSSGPLAAILSRDNVARNKLFLKHDRRAGISGRGKKSYLKTIIFHDFFHLESFLVEFSIETIALTA